MNLTTTFRHMDASDAVKAYTEERLERIQRYFHREVIAAHAIFEVQRDHDYLAEFVVTLPNGLVVQAREWTEDMYSSVDLACSRLERQVRRWKDKIRDHKPHGHNFSTKKSVFEAAGMEPPRKDKGDHAHGAHDQRTATPTAPKIQIVREETYTVRTMRVDEAVMQMNLIENEFFVFNDVDNHRVSVVYRRKDGHYGLIETGGRAPSE